MPSLRIYHSLVGAAETAAPPDDSFVGLVGAAETAAPPEDGTAPP